jgi:hypothetical protein
LISDAENTTAQSHTIRVYIPGSPATTVGSQSFSITALETIQASANKVTVVAYTPDGPGIGGTLQIQVTGSSGTIGGTKTMSFTPASATTWRPDAFELKQVSIVLSGGNTGTITNQLSFVPANTSDTNYVATYTFRIVGRDGHPGQTHRLHRQRRADQTYQHRRNRIREHSTCARAGEPLDVDALANVRVAGRDRRHLDAHADHQQHRLQRHECR